MTITSQPLQVDKVGPKNLHSSRTYFLTIHTEYYIPWLHNSHFSSGRVRGVTCKYPSKSVVIPDFNEEHFVNTIFHYEIHSLVPLRIQRLVDDLQHPISTSLLSTSYSLYELTACPGEPCLKVDNHAKHDTL